MVERRLEQMDDKKETTQEESKDTKGDSGTGDKPETPKVTVDANEAAERLERANAEAKEIEARREENMARQALGGQSEAGAIPVKPEPISDVEYSKKLERGEVNPLEEDGII